MKSKHIFALTLSVALLLACLVLPVSAEAEAWDGTTATQPAGSGTAADPYRIGTGAELYWLSQQASSKAFSDSVILTADIDLGGNEWMPIGPTTGASFRGIFDGQGHSVSNFTVTGQANSGLFGALVNASVKNLTLDQITIVTEETTSGFGGALVGYMQGTTLTGITVGSNVSVTGYNVGGVVGRTWNTKNTIAYCTSGATVTTDSSNAGEAAGGIAGLAAIVDISYCVNTGDITAASNGEQLAGGIAGRFGGSAVGTMQYCLNRGTVSSSHTAGGIAGKNMYNGCSYENCVTTVPVFRGNGDWSGSLVGRFSTNPGSMTNCYAPADDTYGWTGANAANATNCTQSNVAVCTTEAELALLNDYAAAIERAVAQQSALPYPFVSEDGVNYKGVQEYVHGDFYNVRFVANLDDYTQYEAVGFVIEAVFASGDVQSKTYGRDCRYVYTHLTAVSGGDTVALSAAEMQGNYLMAYAIHNIPLSVGEARFTVTPYTVQNGERVLSASYEVVYNNGELVSQSPVDAAAE